MIPKLRVLHPITRLIIGGAQENSMLTADYHNHLPEYTGPYHADIVSGPQTGPEGSLIEETRQRGINLTIMLELLRELSPANNLKALVKLAQMGWNGRQRAAEQFTIERMAAETERLYEKILQKAQL